MILTKEWILDGQTRRWCARVERIIADKLEDRAMQLIDEFESSSRGYYGGAIGYLGLDGTLNHAIIIRTILSYRNELHYRAGAGIVDASVPEKELEEVNLKLNALRTAIEKASAVSVSMQLETVNSKQ